MSNGWMTNIQPGNASAPTEPVTALLMGNSDRSPKRETIWDGIPHVKRGCVVSRGFRALSEDVLDEIEPSGHDAANNQQEQKHEAGDGQFELPIAILVGR